VLIPSLGKTTLVLLFNTVLIRPNFPFSLYPRRCLLFRLPVGGQPIVTTLGMRLAAEWRQQIMTRVRVWETLSHAQNASSVARHTGRAITECLVLVSLASLCKLAQ
jgi:hypothetical protein